MKLFNLDHSPYATRVRIQIKHGQLPLAVEAPPVQLRTPEFVAQFPYGKIPILQLDDGSHLADSWVIMEYLESCFADSGLLPADALERARMQTLARCADTCLGPGAVFPMFAAVAKRDNAVTLVENMDAELQRLDHVLAGQGDVTARSLHLGDVALAPHLSYLLLLAPLFGADDALGGYDAVSAWWQWVNTDAAVAEELGVMQQAAAAFFKK
ncbi:putative GST-like protein YibF [Halioglobus japonicus]|nr:putative GST-like protein YibF [Halioglobus japonicus]